MENTDLELGIWFEGGVYYFHKQKRVWINVPKDIIDCSFKQLKVKYPKQAQFFAHGALPKTYIPKSIAKNATHCYREGRNWYVVGIKPIPRPILAGSKTLSPEYENLRLIDSKVFSLATLICGSFGDNPYKDLLRGECTPTGDRIARSLVRTAATRIFNDPEQSIMELPVNSIDSYYPQRSVGKFGMGFFSILYWIIGTKRTLSIKSFCLDSSNRSYAYEVVIFFDKELKFKLRPIISYTTLTGTCIDLDATSEPFSYSVRSSFLDYMKRTDYVKGVDIFVDGRKRNETKLEHNIIYVRIIEKNLRVEDYAKGISSDVLLTKLFVPSVSTKTIQASAGMDVIIPKSEIVFTKHWDSRFSIVVNDIVLYSNDVGYTVIPGITGCLYVLWKLPSNTKVPVSRDDVILDEDVARITLNELFEQAVEKKVVGFLQLGLIYYIESTSYSNASIVSRILEEQAKKYREVFVPFESDIGLFYPKAVMSVVFDRGYVRNVFIQILKTDSRIKYIGEMFYGKQVFSVKHKVLPDLNPFKTPFLDIILIDERVMKDPQWKSVLSSTYFKQGKLVLKNPKDNANLTEVQLQTLYSMLESFKSTSSLQFNLKYNMGCAALISRIFDDKSSEIFDDLNAFLSNFTPEYTYSKTTVKLWRQDLISIKTLDLCQKSPEYPNIMVNIHKECLKVAESTNSHVWFWFKSMNVSDVEKCTFVAQRVSSHLHYEYLIGFINIESYDMESIVERFDVIYDKVRFANPSIKELKILIYREVVNPFHASIKTFVSRLLSKNQAYPISYTPYIKGDSSVSYTSPPISNVDLINYLFDNSKPLSFEDLPNIGSWKPKRVIKLQALEIAINEGTTKPFVDSVITECFQNSVDAIRKSKIGDPFIDFSTKFYPDHLVLIISDPVGMSIESFLYISIPFLSTKDQKDPAYTGEMGTGFFNVYRESTMVRILTRPEGDSRTFIWEDIPVRVKDRVVDIRKTLKITNSLQDRGTQLEIHMPYSNIRPREARIPQVKDFANLIEMKELVEKRFAFTTTGIKVTEERKEIIGSSIELIKELGKVQFFYVYSESFVSFIYTNGIPMSPIIPIKFTSQSRILINILPGGYIPRQSRTFLDLDKETEDDYYKIKNIAQAYLELRLNLEGTSNYVLDPTLESTTDVKSILPKNMGVDSNQEGCVYYSFPEYGSIAQALWIGADVCDYRPDLPENFEKLYNWVNSKFKGSDGISDLFIKYIIRWFRNKKTVLEETIQHAQALKTKTKSKTLSLLTNLYVKIASELKITGFGRPILAIGPEQHGRSFSMGSNIVIYQASDPEIEEVFYKGFNHYSFISEGMWFTLYGPVGTFTHEMEHIRRQESTEKGDGDHNPYDKPLWPGDKPKSRSFGQCQLEIYTKIAKEGRLWQRFDELLAKS
jgi:hypothetical protein